MNDFLKDFGDKNAEKEYRCWICKKMCPKSEMAMWATASKACHDPNVFTNDRYIRTAEKYNIDYLEIAQRCNICKKCFSTATTEKTT